MWSYTPWACPSLNRERAFANNPAQVPNAWQGFFTSNGKTIADTAAGAQDPPTAQQLVDPGENRPAGQKTSSQQAAHGPIACHRDIFPAQKNRPSERDSGGRGVSAGPFSHRNACSTFGNCCISWLSFFVTLCLTGVYARYYFPAGIFYGLPHRMSRSVSCVCTTPAADELKLHRAPSRSTVPGNADGPTCFESDSCRNNSGPALAKLSHSRRQQYAESLSAGPPGA